MKKHAWLLMLLSLTACAGVNKSAMGGAPVRVPSQCPSGLSGEQELRLGMVKEYVEAGKLYAALATLDSLPNGSAVVLRQKADISRRLGQGEAVLLYKQLLKTCLSGYGDHGLGLIAAQEGDLMQAEQLLSRAAAALPTEAHIRNDLGLAYIYNGKIDKARFELMTAIELEPEYKKPVINLAALFLLRAEPEALDQLADRFKIGGEQVADAMQLCQQIKSSAAPAADDLHGEKACNWLTIGASARLAPLFKVKS